jgi:hypothetical protein
MLVSRKCQHERCCGTDARGSRCSISKGHKKYDTAGETYNAAACDTDPAVPKKMSAECKAFFTAEFCFYECDVNLSKYRCAPGFPVRCCLAPLESRDVVHHTHHAPAIYLLFLRSPCFVCTNVYNTKPYWTLCT